LLHLEFESALPPWGPVLRLFVFFL
jgi:hypothetical protein